MRVHSRRGCLLTLSFDFFDMVILISCEIWWFFEIMMVNWMRALDVRWQFYQLIERLPCKPETCEILSPLLILRHKTKYDWKEMDFYIVC